MRKCISCKNERILFIHGKTSDSFMARYKRKEYEGYVLQKVGISKDSDYISFAYCLDCGKIQDKFPVKSPLFVCKGD